MLLVVGGEGLNQTVLVCNANLLLQVVEHDGSYWIKSDTSIELYVVLEA